ncbi:MAG: hypothetical protein EOP04_09190 [Proteobacteria bacterium]|nr:MAG: hypothetical protein EOP04_09190 [Pseudomonadota bacterium]
MSTIKQQKTVLEFWNAVEFFNFFDLDDALKTIDPECIFKNEDAFPWQHDKLSQDYRFTIFLGISNAGEISAALDEKPDEFTMAEKDTKKRTCVGKIVLEDEGGFARLDYVGLSTLNWAMAKHLQGQIPLSSNFSTYQQSLETYTNSSIVPAFSKIQLKDLPPAYIKRVYEMFVSSTHQQSASCDLWQAPELRFITVRQPKNKKSHFSKYLASYFEKDDMGFADADQSFRRYLMARANDDDRSMGEQQEELLKIFRSFDLKSTCTTTTLDPDFIDDMIDSIFAVKEIEILNSFFLDDLEFGLSTLTQTKGPSLLRSYLTTNSEYTDLFKGVSSATVFESLRPARSPLVRWPTKPSQPLSLMQQFAVNKALDLQKFELLSVNGPPGTGKTTLLRDIIANIILTKANHLSSITHASDAFDSSNQLTVNGFRFSPLKKYLTGHEILVASSNNGAVENISKELPLLKNIDPEFWHR